MRIACPHCAAAYEVPAANLIGRRAVRCARCGREWRPELPAPEVASAPEAPAPAQAPTPPEEPTPSSGGGPEKQAERRSAAMTRRDVPAHPTDALLDPHTQQESAAGTPQPLTAMQRLAGWQPPPARGGRAVRIRWAASILVVALSCWGAVAWHGDLEHMFPPSSRLFAALGLDQDSR